MSNLDYLFSSNSDLEDKNMPKMEQDDAVTSGNHEAVAQPLDHLFETDKSILPDNENTETPGRDDSFFKGAIKSATLARNDELAGILDGLGSLAGIEGLGSLPINKIRRQTETEAKGSSQNAEERGIRRVNADYDKAYNENPKSFLGGQMLGGALTTKGLSKIIPAINSIKGAAALGGLYSYGDTRSPDPKKIGIETVTGAGLSAIGQALAPYPKVVGAALGALGGYSLTDDSNQDEALNNSILGGLGGASAATALPYIAKNLGNVGKQLAMKFGRWIPGIPEDTTSHYIDNSARIAGKAKAGQLDTESLMDSVDNAVGKAKDDVAGLNQTHLDLNNKREGLFNDKKSLLQATQLNPDIPERIMGMLENEKIIQSGLSNKADKELLKTGVNFEKADLMRLLEKIGGSLGQSATTQHKAALTSLKADYDLLSEWPDILKPTQVRDILQQVRRSVNYGGEAGTYNDTLSGARKQFASGISEALKDSAPEYAKIMQQMHERAKVTESMIDYFGTRNKGILALTKAKAGTDPIAPYREEAISNFSKVTGDKSLVKMLDDFERERNLLAQMKNGHGKDQLYPKLTKELNEAEANAKMGNNLLDSIKNINTNTTQSLVTRPTTQIKQDRSLNILEEYADRPLREDMLDAKASAAFGKDGTRGSRLTLLGGAIGGGIGSMMGGGLAGGIGGAIGGGIGSMADRYSGRWLKAAIDGGSKLPASVVIPLQEAASNGGKGLLYMHQDLMKTNKEYRDRFRDYILNQTALDRLSNSDN